MFRPRRDVDLFLDRVNNEFGHGWLQAVEVLSGLFEKDAQIHGQQDRHTSHQELLQLVFEDFRDWLGESKYMSGLKTIPPTRFASSNSNGLWEYCPLLCGVGLMEGLEMAYIMSMMVWDQNKEPFLIMHMHNMLVKRGYIKKEIGLFLSLHELFPTTFFAGDTPPTSNFVEAFQARLQEVTSRSNSMKTQMGRQKARGAFDVHSIMAAWVKAMLQTKSNLSLYLKADWIPDKIPDSALTFRSTLTSLRLAQMPVKLDANGTQSLERTELVEKVLKDGLTEE